MRKIMSIALVLILLVGVFCFSACDDKEEEKEFVFTEDMDSLDVYFGIQAHVNSGTISSNEEQQEAFSSLDDLLGGMLSKSIYSFDVKDSDMTIDVTFGDIVNVLFGGVKYVANGFTAQGFTAFYEKCDDFDYTRQVRVYQFLEQDGEVLYSVQETRIGRLDNILVLEDKFSSSTVQFLVMLTEIDFEPAVFLLGSESVPFVDFSVVGDKIIMSLDPVQDKSTQTPILELSNINSTELDIPAQYADYKSLEVTA